jgi:nitrate/nitrite-specific signal transduction histidine kinase
MNLRRELLLAIGALVVLNLAFAFGAIGLFARMGPAIERILQENVYTIVAAEDILSELAKSSEGGPLSDARKRAIAQALANAEQNVTEEDERPVLEALRRSWGEVARGDGAARVEFVTHVERLILINREAMVSVDESAKRLGKAGAWSAVFIGFSTFLLSLFVLARLQRRFVRPLLELHEVLREAEEGQRLRRCRSVVDAPREVLHVTQAINRLLDERVKTSSVLEGGR